MCACSVRAGVLACVRVFVRERTHMRACIHAHGRSQLTISMEEDADRDVPPER